MPAEDWEWWGTAGHFVAWHRCHFRLHTHVKGYCISTIGDYHPTALQEDFDKELDDGYGCLLDKVFIAGKYYYETMVSRLDVHGEVNWEEDRVEEFRYMTGKEAYEGHMKACKKYDRL